MNIFIEEALKKQIQKNNMLQNLLNNRNKKKHTKRLEARRRSQIQQQNKNNAVIPFGIDKTIDNLHYNFNWLVVYLQKYINDLIIDKNTQEANKIYVELKPTKRRKKQ